MSYEGYEQVLCERGHLHILDCYEFTSVVEENWTCNALIDGQVCGAKIASINSVDDTNCDSYGYRKPIELTPEVTKTCDMGHDHIVSNATYKLSEERYYRETTIRDDGFHINTWHLCEMINDAS